MSLKKFRWWQVGYKNPVAEFIDPVRELKPALKWGSRGVWLIPPFYVKLDLTPANRIYEFLLIPVGRAGVKVGLKGGMTHTPLLKLDLTPVQDLWIWLLMLPVGRAGVGARGGTDWGRAAWRGGGGGPRPPGPQSAGPGGAAPCGPCITGQICVEFKKRGLKVVVSHHYFKKVNHSPCKLVGGLQTWNN